MKQPVIYWFRNDLRLYDNIALTKATESNRPIFFVYILSDDWFKTGSLGFSRISDFRLNHLKNSLFRLNAELSEINTRLNVFRGKPDQIIIKIAKLIKAHSVYTHLEYTHIEQLEEKAIEKEIPINGFWGNMVYSPSDVPFAPDASPYYYTKFMKKVIVLPNTPTIAPVKKVKGYDEELPIDGISLEKSLVPSSPLDLMYRFINSNVIEDYHITRELFEGEQYSSFLSPYLADGSLSANLFYQELDKKQKSNPHLEPSITKLKQQLIWRDYYRFLFLRYGNKLFKRHGIRNKNRDRYDDKLAFDLWRNGKTEHALINAFMNELRTTGFLSNRGRMLASFYLSKVMQVNWLWGAAWFEHCLIDYDVCNNYGNWAYQSGVGTDSRFNRTFNLDRQVQKFDPQKEYIKKWGKNES